MQHYKSTLNFFKRKNINKKISHNIVYPARAGLSSWHLAGWLCVAGHPVLCRCSTAPLSSAHQVPGPPASQHDNQKCLQTLPTCPGLGDGGSSPTPIETSWAKTSTAKSGAEGNLLEKTGQNGFAYVSSSQHWLSMKRALMRMITMFP